MQRTVGLLQWVLEPRGRYLPTINLPHWCLFQLLSKSVTNPPTSEECRDVTFYFFKSLYFPCFFITTTLYIISRKWSATTRGLPVGGVHRQWKNSRSRLSHWEVTMLTAWTLPVSNVATLCKEKLVGAHLDNVFYRYLMTLSTILTIQFSALSIPFPTFFQN